MRGAGKMIRNMKQILVIILIAVPGVFYGAEIVPVGDFRILGGQYYYKTSPSSLSGNLSFTIVPAVKFNDKFSIVPACMLSYRGTKEVNDLAGGGTLFQDAQSHFISMKGIYSVLPTLKFKLGSSYRIEWLRETKDENWNKGLFDYNKINYGFETEYSYVNKQTVRAGIDFFNIKFPNYTTLASSMSAVSGLAPELQGTNTLNCDNMMASLKFNNAFGKFITELGYSVTNKKYPDQPLCISESAFSSDKRSDTYSLITGNVSYPFKIFKTIGLVTSMDLRYLTNESNQGHADAKNIAYEKDYYNYATSVIAPAVHFIFGTNAIAFSIGGSYSAQNYKERLAQDADGAYLKDAAGNKTNEKIYINETELSFGITCPLSAGFKLRVITSFIDAKSNMKNESTYAYNYNTSNYLFGISYEF